MLSQIMTKISGGVTFLRRHRHDRRRRYRHRSLRFSRQPGHQFRRLKEEMPDA